MGTTTDAYLFYGFTIYDPEEGEGEMPPWMDDESDEGSLEWEDVLATKLGLSKPDGAYIDHEGEYRTYWKERGKLAEGAGCVVDTHCSGEYPIYFVALKDKYFRASRGNPTEIDMGSMVITSMEKEKLRRFCELLEIPWQEPKWYLASYWG